MVVSLVLVAALVAVVLYMSRDRAQERREWVSERAQLLNRIQAPERAVFDQLPVHPTEPLEPDDAHLVGTIQE